MKKTRQTLTAAALLLVVAACGASSEAVPTDTGIAVEVQPRTPELLPAGRVTFSAAVTGSTITGVTWTVQEVTTGGTVTSAGVYTAPATTGTYHVVATSVADVTKSGMATVTVTSSPAIQVTISPRTASVAVGSAIAFSAMVTGTTDPRVNWTVQEVATGGTVTSTGLYTAPGTPGTYHVVATSVADGTRSDTATVSVSITSSTDTTGILAADRRTQWRPGIPGGIPARTTICATANAATYGNGATDATAHIQGLLNGCPSGQVVRLPAGTYLTSAGLNIPSGRVLRGDGPALTRIIHSGGDPALLLGGWGNGYGTVANVVGSVPKGATSVTVASASGFVVGDIVQIDQTDDPSYVWIGDCNWFKRNNGGLRSVGQTNEITSITGNTLGLASPIHVNFDAAFSPQVTRSTGAMSVGLEDLYVRGGGSGQIIMTHNAYSWIRNIESAYSTGRHVALSSSYRCVIRDSYFHHPGVSYNSGSGGYGVSIQQQTSDSLVENNIIYSLNKPLLFEASGGGNVAGYNYIDDAQLGGAFHWQETDITTHCSFSHYELIEGNYAPHMGTDNTHGGAGWLTFFRNHATGKHRSALFGPNPGTTGTPVAQRQNLCGLDVAYGTYFTNSLGNAFLYPGVTGALSLASYLLIPPNPPGTVNTLIGERIGFRTGAETWEPRPWDTLVRHGNFDYASGVVQWDPAISIRTLPSSLYLELKPAFFGAYPWPWITTDSATPVGVLPAKARFEAMP